MAWFPAAAGNPHVPVLAIFSVRMAGAHRRACVDGARHDNAISKKGEFTNRTCRFDRAGRCSCIGRVWSLHTCGLLDFSAPMDSLASPCPRGFAVARFDDLDHRAGREKDPESHTLSRSIASRSRCDFDGDVEGKPVA